MKLLRQQMEFMAKTKKAPRPKINAGHVERVLRNHINPRTTKFIPEAQIPYANSRWDSYRADYVSISAAGYVTEFEVKVSMSDWKNDLTKSKWANVPDWVSQFVYVVPEHLGVPDWVPAHAGIWHVCVTGNRMWIKIVRTPKRVSKVKVPQEVVSKWIGNLYYRFWNMRIERDKLLPPL